MRPLLVREKQPGDPGFVEQLDRAISIARSIPKGTELIYIGPDDYVFKTWTPICHMDEVTVAWRPVVRSAGVGVELPCGEIVAINVWDLAYPNGEEN